MISTIEELFTVLGGITGYPGEINSSGTATAVSLYPVGHRVMFKANGFGSGMD